MWCPVFIFFVLYSPKPPELTPQLALCVFIEIVLVYFKLQYYHQYVSIALYCWFQSFVELSFKRIQTTCMNVTHAYIVCILKKDMNEKIKKRIIPYSWLYKMRMQWKKLVLKIDEGLHNISLKARNIHKTQIL